MGKVQITAWAAALCLAGASAYAVAQTKDGHGKACDHACPMHEAAALSDIKVEPSKQGAVIQLVAKRADDVGKVQQRAQEIAAMLKSGVCLMHDGHGGMHGRGHQHPAPNAR